MSRNERLRDSTIVVSEWREGSLPHRVTIVDGTPRLETQRHGIWSMHVRSADVASLLRIHVEMYVKTLRLKIERCRAGENEAEACEKVGERLHWARLRRETEAILADLPGGWTVEWRGKR